MKIRTGNDFDVSWSITRAGQPESFDPDMPCTVLVINSACSWIKFEPKFNIIGNTIKFRVPADKQQSGKYRLLIQYKKKDLISEHAYRTYTTDICNAYEIVPDSCGENLHEGDVSLTSDVKIWSDGKDGLNAYQLAVLVEGFPGTVEEYLQSLRKPAEDAAEDARTAINKLESLETIIASKESARQVNEQNRERSESGRIEAEILRSENETRRVTAENKRVLDEQERLTAETSRNDAEGARVQHEKDRDSAEGLRVTNENARKESEVIRGNAETSRVSNENIRVKSENTRNTTFAEKIAEIDTAIKNAGTQSDYAKQQGDYSKEQGGYAKQQGDYANEKGIEAATVIAQAGADPLLGRATTMQTTATARSNCNLYNFQAGVTYAVTFVPVFDNDGPVLLIDGVSYSEFPNKGIYGKFHVLGKNRNRCLGIIPGNYAGNFFYTSLKVVENKLNIALLKIWDNSIAISLNGSEWQIKDVDPSTIINYPLTHEYGFSPVIIDAYASGSSSAMFGLINSVREFPFLLTDEMKDALWNNGRPDLVVLDDRLNNNYPVLPFESIHMNNGSKTDIPGGWRFTGYVDAMFQFSGYEEAPKRYVIISFKYKASHLFTAENYQAGSDKIPYTFEPSEEYKEVRCLTTLGKETYNRFEIKLTGVTDPEAAFLEIIDFEYENAVCSGEYLAAGFRKNRLIDTSYLKRDIVINGEIDLQYHQLYEDIIYKKSNPNTIPQFVGQRWFNTISKAWYVANGTASTSDWVTNSGATAMAYRIMTDENNVVTGIENIYDDTPMTLAIRSNVYVVTELPADNPIGYVFDGQTWTDPFINQEKSLS